jgi:hypothetical protein
MLSSYRSFNTKTAIDYILEKYPRHDPVTIALVGIMARRQLDNAEVIPGWKVIKPIATAMGVGRSDFMNNLECALQVHFAYLMVNMLNSVAIETETL